ncbi:PQ loop repeat-domain-containing protein [Dissophora ornata]|nr:PQ loop repeat-domain-containing protein [Dissophora ornata]
MPTTKVILENVFGMLGIIFWSFQLLPQVFDNYKAKTTKGLSASMFLLWTLAAIGFGSYSIVEELSIPIIIQPHVFGFFSTICYLQCIYYSQKERWSRQKILLAGLVVFLILAGIEAGAIYGTRVKRARHRISECNEMQ